MDWNGNLAFEDATGRYPAAFDFDPSAATSYVRCRVYGEKFASPFNDAWFDNIKFDEVTGASLDANWPGAIINVAEDMLADIDRETGQELSIPISEHKRLVQQAVTTALAGQGTDAPTKVHITLEWLSGRKDVLGSVAV